MLRDLNRTGRIGALLGLPAALVLLLAGCTAAPAPGTGPDGGDGKLKVEVKEAELLTPSVDEDAPPLLLPKPKRSPDAARSEEVHR